MSEGNGQGSKVGDESEDDCEPQKSKKAKMGNQKLPQPLQTGKLLPQPPQTVNLPQPLQDVPVQPTPDPKADATPQDAEPGQQDMETAYRCKNYAYVLELLLKDRSYPENFKFTDIEGTKDGKELKKFVKKINNLHKLIGKDDVEGIKKILPIEPMKLYLSMSNESALFVAYSKKKYKVCSYLSIIEADFKDKNEEKVLLDYDFESEAKLGIAMANDSSSVENKNVSFLISKTCKRPDGDEQLDKIIRGYYEALDRIPEISIIFQVLETVSNLNILFDFNRVNVNHICPTAGKSFGGTEWKQSKLYIGAKECKENNRGINQILGTIAHECTHMAVYAVYNNLCNPYKKDDWENEKKFEDIYLGIYRSFNESCDVYSGVESNHPWKILRKVFDENKAGDYPSETIVALSQILAENEGNRDWVRENFPEFYEFYQKVLLKCEEHVKDVHFRKMTENFNKHEIEKLKNLNLSFKNISKFDFFNKNVLIVEGENTNLSVLRTLQKLYGKDFDGHSEKYLIVPFHKLVEDDHGVTECLQSMLVETVIIRLDFLSTPDHDIRFSLVSAISDFLEDRKKLKFAIVVPKNEKRVAQFLKKSCKPAKIVQKEDEEFSLNDLEGQSVDRILRKKITFQGKETVLRDLIQKDEFLFNFLNFKSTLMLCSGENVKIGGKLFGTSSLEGAYADVIQKMNVTEFCKKVKKSDFSHIFIITGFQGQKKYDNLMSILRDLSKREHINENLCADYQETVFSNKKILFRECELLDTSFKNFCHLNQEKTIYLINLVYNQEPRPIPDLIVKRYYNPKFYNERRYKRKILTKLSDLPINSSEQFIISKLGSKDVITGSNIHCCLQNGEARAKFEELASKHKIVHWFSVEEVKKGKKVTKEIVWKNSIGSVDNLPVINSRNCIDEEKFAYEIKDRKVVLLADDPGTGKSTSLTKLYELRYSLTFTICGENWLIRINLRDHLNSIRTIDDKNFNTTKLIEFLSEIDENLKTDLNRNFLNIAITFKNFKKPLLIVLDGFDEIPNQNDRDKIIFLSRYLANNTECKIWLTTRLNFKEELESKLATFAVEFEPINGKAKINFIKKYFRQRLEIIIDKPDSEKLKNYAICLKNNLLNFFSKDSEKFIGTPMQLYLILENCVGCFKRYVSGVNENPDFSDLGEDLLQIYDRFLVMKYEVYFRKTSLNEASKNMNEDFYNDYLKNLAESMIFKEDFSEFLEKHKALMLATGIVKLSGDDIEFIHLTFREYFLSKVVLDYLFNRNHKKLNTDVVEILIKDIFLQPDFQMLRNFLSLHLKNLNNWDEMPDLKEIGVVMGLLWGKNPTVKDNKGTVLHIALEEKNETLFSFIIYCCKKKFSDEQFYNLLIATNSRFHTVFHVVASMRSKILCEFLLREVRELNLWLEWGKDLLNYKVGSKDSPLGLAKRKRNYEVFHVIEAELNKLTVQEVDSS